MKRKVIHYFSICLLFIIIPFTLPADYTPIFFQKKNPQEVSTPSAGQAAEEFNNRSLFRQQEIFLTEKDEDPIGSAPPTFPDGDENNYTPGGNIGQVSLSNDILILSLLFILHTGYYVRKDTTRHNRKENKQKNTFYF